MSVFDCPSAEVARQIILTPEVGLTTDERWIKETKWLAERLDVSGTVVDYGCGIGRMSSVLVERGCTVLGVDSSLTMRRMADDYVNRPGLFAAVSPKFFSDLIAGGFSVDGAISCWCLQHIAMPELDHVIDTLAQACGWGCVFWAMERGERYIPVEGVGWTSDGILVADRLAQRFSLQTEEAVPTSLCAPGATLRKWRKM